MREVRFEKHLTMHAAGSLLASFGNTKVICTATVEESVPPYRLASGLGWLTAEYGMLPASTNTRKHRPGAKPDGRSTEISRLIGRSLRAAMNFSKLGPRTIWVDCDVLQADGGTRTAAITGGCLAVAMACEKLIRDGLLTENPMERWIAAISVGYVKGELITDLDYAHDSKADVDMNVVGDEQDNLIEVQGTGEQGVFNRQQLNLMLDAAQTSIRQLITLQKQALTD